jgi:hypothetical protein
MGRGQEFMYTSADPMAGGRVAGEDLRTQDWYQESGRGYLLLPCRSDEKSSPMQRGSLWSGPERV